MFAGRAFKEDEVLLWSWMTLYLPINIPMEEDAWDYAFAINETHKALALDYGSVINHHDSANTRPIHFSDFENDIHFQVRRGF